VGPRCGDGLKNGDELCDRTDFLDETCEDAQVCNDACDACEDAGPFCGDGETNGTEECDVTDPGSACGDGEVCTDCACAPEADTCGDEEFDPEIEACDTDADCDVDEACLGCVLCVPTGCNSGEVEDGGLATSRRSTTAATRA
jgi:hypothetical protein